MAAARKAGCYKVILDCSEDNVDFYARSGFKRKEVHMVWLLLKLTVLVHAAWAAGIADVV